MCLLIWTVFSGEWCGPWASCLPLVDIFLNFVNKGSISLNTYSIWQWFHSFFVCILVRYLVNFILLTSWCLYYIIILSISLRSSLHSNTSCIHQFRCYQGVLKHKRILRVVHPVQNLMNISPLISKKCQWVTICFIWF